MPTPAFFELLKQLLHKPATNLFPFKFVPRSVTKFLERGKINPPVPVPKEFRGQLAYDIDKCIGCAACERVCPTQAIEMVGKIPNRKIIHFTGRCCFCGQCVDVCPVKCLAMSEKFLLADTDNYSDALIVGGKPKAKKE
ncbi:4Fe-4S binding protein [archaeon]